MRTSTPCLLTSSMREKSREWWCDTGAGGQLLCERCVSAKMCFVYCVAGESVLRMRAPCTVRWKSPFFFEMYRKQTKPRTNLVAAQALYKVHATKSRRLKGKQKHLSPQPLEEEERERLPS